MSGVTVAIPVRDGGPLLGEVLAAVRRQAVGAEVELLVADSGSSDGSAALARAHGAEVIAVERFSHGGTRNLLMERAQGEHVAFLTQDATPADDGWLAALLAGFALGDDVALVCGPYRARPGAPPWTRRELAEWFAAMTDGAAPRVVRAADLPRGPTGRPLASPLSFHTDANGCVARAAWRQVPFRDVAYAEDQQLALDMLAAGHAKVFQPGAAVVHSHAYPPWGRLRRTFDEFRALADLYELQAPAHPRVLLGTARRETARDRAAMRAQGLGGRALDRLTLAAAAQHVARGAGAALGTRAAALPAPLRRRLSLEGRAG